jgi:hypothetical protein
MNMGTADRIIRFIAGIVVLIVAFIAVSGVAQIVLWVVGGILVLTALVGFCPLYAIFHLSTKRK